MSVGARRNNEAMVHLIKATIGGGCLAMPDAFRNVGWAMGIIGTAIIGMSVLNMMSSIVSVNENAFYKLGVPYVRSAKFVRVANTDNV